MQSIAPRIGANQHDHVSRTARLRSHDLVMPGDADAHGIDEWIAVVRRIEEDLAADGWNAEAVAVTANAANDVVKEIAISGLIERTEAQCIENRVQVVTKGNWFLLARLTRHS